MTIKKYIDRPLLSIVINVMVVAVGIIALTRLPIEKFPDIAPPTVYLWASYPGASAETVQKSVVAPLEQAINGVDNMMYMTSSASNGSASISIYFKQGTNADMAAVNVQNRVVQAQAQLPAEVLKMGVAVEKQQPGQLRILALESPGGTYNENFLSNYFYNNLRPAILRIQGVGKCEVWGGQYALRIWLKPEAMARYGIVPSDITTLLEEQNVEASIGAIGENTPGTFQYTLRYTGRKQDVTDLLWCLPSFHLSAREFPPVFPFTISSLCGEYFISFANDRSYYFYLFHTYSLFGISSAAIGIRKIYVLSDKVHELVLFFAFGCRIAVGMNLRQQKGHVVGKCAHGLHALGV